MTTKTEQVDHGINVLGPLQRSGTDVLTASVALPAFTVSTALAVNTGSARFPITRAMTIVRARAMVGTAPTGASLIIDVNKNGTTIYSTQANRPTITATNTDSGTGSTPNTTSLAAGDYLTVDIDQVGSTIPGSNLVVVVDVTIP